MHQFSRRKVLRVTVAATLSVSAGCSTYISETTAFARLAGSTRVDTGYEHYVFFLSTSEPQSVSGQTQQLTQLRSKFLAFGKSIGGRNLAIWANRADSDALSLELGKYFLDRYSRWSGRSLEYIDGPYIILSNAHPSDARLDLAQRGTTAEPIVIAIGLRGLSADRITELVGYLEARLRRNQITEDTTLGVAWIKLKSALDSIDLPREFKDVLLELLSRRPKKP